MKNIIVVISVIVGAFFVWYFYEYPISESKDSIQSHLQEYVHEYGNHGDEKKKVTVTKLIHIDGSDTHLAFYDLEDYPKGWDIRYAKLKEGFLWNLKIHITAGDSRSPFTIQTVRTNKGKYELFVAKNLPPKISYVDLKLYGGKHRLDVGGKKFFVWHSKRPITTEEKRNFDGSIYLKFLDKELNEVEVEF